ncbi:MAG: hypothetical protein HYT87_13825 [Nitrospirae bacterium]|nr:hypothetical protein [Nitrospirota bacterium]
MRLLIGVTSATGHFTPTVPLALEMRRRGHEVIYAGDPEIESQLRGLNFPFVTAGPVMGIKDSIGRNYPEMTRLDGLKQTRFMVEGIYLKWMDRILEEVDAMLPAVKPDIVATDMMTVLPLACEKHNIPWASLVLFMNFIPGPEAIPPTLGWGPARNGATRFFYRRFWDLIVAMGGKWNRELNRARVKFGLPSQKRAMLESFISPWLCICYTGFEFEFPRTDLPGQFHMVGPSLWDGLLDGEAVPDDLRKPVVYFTQGTSVSQIRKDFFRTGLDALGSIPGSGVVTIGFAWQPEELGAIPPNVHVRRFVPNSKLLPKVDVIVHHGGNSSTLGAVVAGVPQVVVPFNWDQPDNARRVQDRGLGIVLRRKGLTSTKLAEAIRQVLSNPGYKDRAGQVAESMKRYDAPRSAADLLEELASTRRPVLRLQ